MLYSYLEMYCYNFIKKGEIVIDLGIIWSILMDIVVVIYLDLYVFIVFIEVVFNKIGLFLVD